MSDIPDEIWALEDTQAAYGRWAPWPWIAEMGGGTPYVKRDRDTARRRELAMRIDRVMEDRSVSLYLGPLFDDLRAYLREGIDQ